MFGWLKDQNPDEEVQKPDLADLRALDIAVVFKHSLSCPTSWAADKQVKSFSASQPAIPVYTILARQDRELSQQIAAFTGVRHESPQVIVLRKGIAIATASHQDVTAEFLNHWVGSK